MARLTAAARRKIPKSRFGVPSKAPGSGSYPMNDRKHAILAEGRSAGKSVHGAIVAKAKRLFPGLGGGKKKSKLRGTLGRMKAAGAFKGKSRRDSDSDYA